MSAGVHNKIVKNEQMTGNPIEVVIPFFVLLAQYSFMGLTAAQIAMAICALVVLSKYRLSLRIPKNFKYFFIFFVFVIFADCGKLLIGDSSSLWQINRIIGYSLLFVSAFIVCAAPFDEDRMYKVWKIATIVYCFGLLFHIFGIEVLHHQVDPISIIPGYSLRTNGFLATSRPMSFFREPSMFAASIIPFLFLALKRRDFRWSVFTSFFLLISSSTVGVVICVLLWVLFLLRSDVKIEKKAFAITLLALMTVVFATAPIFQDAFSKFMETSQGGGTYTARITVGFEVLSKMSPHELVLGAAASSPEIYIFSNSGSFSEMSAMYYLLHGNLFLNTVAQLFFRYGIIGTILLLICLVALLKNENYEAKDLIVVYLVLAFFESALLNSYFFYYVMMIMMYIPVAEKSFCSAALKSQ